MIVKPAHRFGLQIMHGRKKQIIERTLRCAPGEPLQFEIPAYGPHGLTVSHFETVCSSVQALEFGPSGVFVDKVALPRPQAENFARAEGFIDLTEMKDWFYARHQARHFVGFVLKWD